MTNDDTPVPTAGADQRIDHAVDAIRSMSQDLADEVAPRPGLSAATRQSLGILDRCHPSASMMRSVPNPRKSTGRCGISCNTCFRREPYPATVGGPAAPLLRTRVDGRLATPGRVGMCRAAAVHPSGGFFVPSPRNAHHGSPTPAVVWAARGRWLRYGWAHVPNGQTFLPPVANARSF
jgi:hypothetical protein